MAASPDKAVPASRRNFTLYFMLAMLATSAVVFISFRNVMRESVAQRSEISLAHLKSLHAALQTYQSEAGNNSAYPEELSGLFPKYISDPETFFHPAWPERPGYIYIPDVRPSDGPETILTYENLPVGKERLARLILLKNGEIQSLDDAEFQKRLADQESKWQGQKRLWQPLPVNTDRLLSR